MCFTLLLAWKNWLPMDSESHGVWQRSKSSPLPPHSVDRLAGPNSVGRSVSLQSAETGRGDFGDLVGRLYVFWGWKFGVSYLMYLSIYVFSCIRILTQDASFLFLSWRSWVIYMLEWRWGLHFFSSCLGFFSHKNLLRFQSLAKIPHVCLHSRN